MRLGVVCFTLLARAALPQTASTQASALIDAGIELSHQGKFNEAGDRFVRALALDPNLSEAHYLLGLVRQQDGRTDSALASFRSALKISPRFAEAQARVCELSTVLARARDTGFVRARTACIRAITLNANDPEPHFHLGWLESKLGSHAKAIQEYQTVLRLSPEFPRAKSELAMAYLDLQDFDRAIPILKDVVASDSQDGNARFRLGAALAKQGDCASAIPLLESATQSAQTQYVLAGCYKKAKRDADAQAALVKVRELREGADLRMQAKYKAAVAHQYAEAGKLDKAIIEYRGALALIDDLSLKIDLAVALLRNRKPQEVLPLLAEETDPLARYQVALAYFSLGRFEDAVTTLKAAVGARPDFVEAWYQLGLSLLELGRTAHAEGAFRRSSELRPDEPTFRRAWAETLNKLGRVQEAREQTRLAAPATK